MGHFNVSGLEQLKAVVGAASKLHSPVMIGTSEGERNWIGLRQAVALVKSLQDDWRPIFLNADHTKSIQAAKQAVETGYDSVHFDGSALTLLENIRQTKVVAEYARNFNSSISVEGELGYLRGESQVLRTVIKLRPSDYTDPQEARKFIDETGVRALSRLLSKPEWYAKLVGSINAPLSGFVNVLAGTIRGLITVLGGVKDAKA